MTARLDQCLFDPQMSLFPSKTFKPVECNDFTSKIFTAAPLTSPPCAAQELSNDFTSKIFTAAPLTSPPCTAQELSQMLANFHQRPPIPVMSCGELWPSSDFMTAPDQVTMATAAPMSSGEVLNILPQTDQHRVSSPPATNNELTHLIHNPMFSDLQATLASDCVLQAVPYTLVHTNSAPGLRLSRVNADLLVEDATLQAEFRQLAPLGNRKVGELETFYNTQSAAVLAQRSDALVLVQHKQLEPDQLGKELDSVNGYYDDQQGRLALRVSQSLLLLKQALPKEQAQPGGAIKRNKSRLLNPRSVAIMTDWYERHSGNPYPSEEEKAEIAELGGISLTQVKAWFANKRNRSYNTKPKREKHKLQRQLARICEHIKNTETCVSGSDDSTCVSGKLEANNNYSLLIDNFSSMVDDKTWEMKQLSYSNATPGFEHVTNVPLSHDRLTHMTLGLPHGLSQGHHGNSCRGTILGEIHVQNI